MSIENTSTTASADFMVANIDLGDGSNLDLNNNSVGDMLTYCKDKGWEADIIKNSNDGTHLNSLIYLIAYKESEYMRRILDPQNDLSQNTDWINDFDTISLVESLVENPNLTDSQLTILFKSVFSTAANGDSFRVWTTKKIFEHPNAGKLTKNKILKSDNLTKLLECNKGVDAGLGKTFEVDKMPLEIRAVIKYRGIDMPYFPKKLTDMSVSVKECRNYRRDGQERTGGNQAQNEVLFKEMVEDYLNTLK